MYRLLLTKLLAQNSFNAMVLACVERDALCMASLRLEKSNPGVVPAESDLIHEANNLLPSPSDYGASMRHFFATQHQLNDGGFDDIHDMAHFISERSSRIEEVSAVAMKESRSAPEWTQVLADLAEGYSYVIEAADNLQARGMVALRRTDDLEAITSRPDPDVSWAKVQLFDKATAFYEQRKAEEKPSLREQYR